MLKLFCNILGEDYNILKNDLPSSKNKIITLGTVLFIPVFLWLLQGFGLVHIILDKPAWMGIIIGLLFTLIIFIIERAIVSSPSNWKIGIFRVLLGLLIAILGAVVMDEIFFHEDINNHMSTYVKNDLNEKYKKIDQLHEVELQSLQNEVNQKFETWNNALAEVKAEADGTGGSGIRGVSKITEVKMQLMHQQENDYKDALERVSLLKEQIKKEKEEVELKYTAGFNENGILTRLKVMFSFIKSDTLVLITYLFFTFIFIIMEFMVIILKWTYGKTHYDEKIMAMESMGTTRSRMMKERHNSMFRPEKHSSEYLKAERLIKNTSNSYLN